MKTRTRRRRELEELLFEGLDSTMAQLKARHFGELGEALLKEFGEVVAEVKTRPRVTREQLEKVLLEELDGDFLISAQKQRRVERILGRLGL